MRLTFTCAIIAALAGCAGRPELTTEYGPMPGERDIRRHPAIGCYALHVGHWGPTAADSGAVFYDLPHAIDLRPRRLVVNRAVMGDEIAFELRPRVEAYHGQVSQAYWAPFVGSDSLDLVWTDGSATTVARLRRQPDGNLEGVARTGIDLVPSPSAEAQLRAERMACGNSSRVPA
jgi:hypothetical protein